MGRVYLDAAGDERLLEGVQAMTDALAAFPADPRIALMLGNLQARRGNYAAAKSSLAMVLASRVAGDTLQAQARRLLVQIEEALMLQSIRADGPSSPAPGESPGSGT
jgi:uncharacterized protein HemY